MLDPAGPPRVSVFSTNYPKLDVRLYSVTPDDWPKWIEYRQSKTKRVTSPPGRIVVSKIIPVKTFKDEIVETSIDLSPALSGEYGQMILIVKPIGQIKKSTDRYDEDELDRGEAWIQRTDIGVDAFVDRTNLIAWTTSIKDGAALSGVEVALLPDQANMQTGADGLVRFSLTSESRTSGRNLLIARRNNDVAILPDTTEHWNESGGSWFRTDPKDSLLWYVFDDRKMYQPGEDVHLKGWIRRINNEIHGDVNFVGEAIQDVAYVLKDARYNPIRVGTLHLNSFGAFDTVLSLPKDIPLGRAQLDLQALTGIVRNSHRHSLEVQQFRRPEFEISTTNATDGPVFVGGAADVLVRANYYAGGGLPNAPVTWRVNSSDGEFTPPNRSDFTFGVWKPWWTNDDDSEGEFNSKTFSSSTDAEGKHRLCIDFDSVKRSLPAMVTASASVTDVNRQTWSASTTLLVHPANVYVGLKSKRTFVQQGEPLAVQAIVSDLDGHLVTAREIKMSAFLLDWRRDNEGELKAVETNRQDCSIKSDASPVTCSFQPVEGSESTA